MDLPHVPIIMAICNQCVLTNHLDRSATTRHMNMVLPDYPEKIIITIILVNIEITIIQTIIFKFENVMHLFNLHKCSNPKCSNQK